MIRNARLWKPNWILDMAKIFTKKQAWGGEAFSDSHWYHGNNQLSLWQALDAEIQQLWVRGLCMIWEPWLQWRRWGNCYRSHGKYHCWYTISRYVVLKLHVCAAPFPVFDISLISHYESQTQWWTNLANKFWHHQDVVHLSSQSYCTLELTWIFVYQHVMGPFFCFHELTCFNGSV